jgi:hypothetical protein
VRQCVGRFFRNQGGVAVAVAGPDTDGGAMGCEVGMTGALSGTGPYAGERGISVVGVFDPLEVDRGPLLALRSRERIQLLLSRRPRRPHSRIEPALLLTRGM